MSAFGIRRPGRLDRPKETPQEYRSRTSRNKLVHEFKLKPLEIQLLKERVNRQKGRGYVADEHDAYLLHLDDVFQKERREREKKENEKWFNSPEGKKASELARMREEDYRMQKIHEKLRYNERQEKMIQENKRFRQNREMMGEEDERSRVLREHSNETERLMLLQRQREMAMLLPTIEEPVVIDRSDQEKMNLIKGGKYSDMEGYGTTGVGFRKNIGERHAKAILNDVSAQEIRTQYWAIPEAERPTLNAFGVSLATQYNVKPTTIVSVITRRSWTGSLYPRVEGEPEENLLTLNKTELQVLTEARKKGLLTAVGKGQRARLTDEQILEQREEVARLLREKDTEKGRKKAERDEAKRLKKEADDLKKAEEKVRKKMEREAEKQRKKEEKTK